MIWYSFFLCVYFLKTLRSGISVLPCLYCSSPNENNNKPQRSAIALCLQQMMSSTGLGFPARIYVCCFLKSAHAVPPPSFKTAFETLLIYWMKLKKCVLWRMHRWLAIACHRMCRRNVSSRGNMSSGGNVSSDNMSSHCVLRGNYVLGNVSSQCVVSIKGQTQSAGALKNWSKPFEFDSAVDLWLHALAV